MDCWHLWRASGTSFLLEEILGVGQAFDSKLVRAATCILCCMDVILQFKRVAASTYVAHV